MKSYKEFISEENKSYKNADIVKILRSSDFGMSEEGGNGDARMIKNKIVLKEGCFYGCDKRAKQIVQEWKPDGTYYEYFLKNYNVVVEVLDYKVFPTGGRIYGKKTNDGVIELYLTV